MIRRRTAFALVLLAVLSGATAGLAEPRYPALSGRVVDEAGLLSPAARARIVAQLEVHERATSNQVVLAVIASLQGYDIADYGVGLGRAWKIGTKENNGVLLIVAPNERRLRIEVGYGLEGTLTDALAAAIIRDEITPAFRQGRMEEGVDRGISAILRVLEGMGQSAAPRRPPDMEAVDWFQLLLVIMFILIIIRLRLGGSGFSIPFGGSTGSRSGPSWTGGGGSFGGGGASGRW
jgi:uncharacterized protein